MPQQMLLTNLFVALSVLVIVLSDLPTEADDEKVSSNSASTRSDEERPLSTTVLSDSEINQIIQNDHKKNKTGPSNFEDDDDDDDGKEPCHSHLFFIIIYGPLFGIVCGVGILGNSMSFAVLHADPPTRFKKRNYRPRLVDQFSVEQSIGGLSHYRSSSRDSSDRQPDPARCGRCRFCCPCCSCCCRRQARRKSSQRSFHKRSNNSVTSVSLVAMPTKSANTGAVGSTAILKRISKNQLSRTNMWAGNKRRVKSQSVSSYLLKALAITDNVYLATSALVQIYSAVAIYFRREKEFEKVFYYLQKYFWPINYLAQLGTVWMMVLVAANRYIAVCRPLHASRLCTKAKVRRQMIVLAAGLFLYNLPRFFEFDYRPTNVSGAGNYSEGEENQTVNYGLVTYPLYNILYENVAYCLVAFLLPLSILVFFNVRLMATLRSAEKFRPTQLGSAAEDATPNAGIQSSLGQARVRGTSSSETARIESTPRASQVTPFPSSSNPDPPSAHQTEVVVNDARGRRATPKATTTILLASDSIVSIDSDHTHDTKASPSPIDKRTSNDASAKSPILKSPVNADERNVTFVMIIIILTFIVCETPASINQILFYLVDKRSRTTCSPYMKFYHISNLLIVLNSALNFFIYFLFRKKFQTQLWSIFSCKNQQSH